MRTIYVAAILLILLGANPAMAELHESMVEQRVALVDKLNALSDEEKRELLDRANERLHAEQPTCGGKVGKLRCAFENATWGEWLLVFIAIGILYLIRSGSTHSNGLLANKGAE